MTCCRQDAGLQPEVRGHSVGISGTMDADNAMTFDTRIEAVIRMTMCAYCERQAAKRETWVHMPNSGPRKRDALSMHDVLLLLE